jgi:hypothetical protein
VYTVGQGISKSVKHQYTHGLQEADVVAETGAIYCHNGKQDGSDACVAQELSAVRMDGAIVRLDNDMYTICAQPTCGSVFKIDACNTSSDQYGPRCAACTLDANAATFPIPMFVSRILQNRLRPTGLPARNPAELDAITEARVCAMCEKPLKLNRHIYLFGHDTYMCSRHKGAPLRMVQSCMLAAFGPDPPLIDEEASDAALANHKLRVESLIKAVKKRCQEDKMRRDAAKSANLAKRQKRNEIANGRSRR